MKKFTSILTSLSVISAMALAAVPFSVSAAGNANTVALELVTDKTEFTAEEVSSGKAKATVYVKSSTEFDASQEVVAIAAALKSNDWDAVSPANFQFMEPNQLGTKNNGASYIDCFDPSATMIGSIWTESKPTDVAYAIGDFTEFGYSSSIKPKFILMSSSGTGFIQTGCDDAGKYIAQFDIEIPTTAEAGEYTLEFCDTEVAIGSFANGGKQVTYEDIKTTGLTFTVGGDSSTTDPDTPGEDDDDILWGDANLDKKVNVRDCAFIANALANGAGDSLPINADYNRDNKKNVRDAAAIAKALADGTLKPAG